MKSPLIRGEWRELEEVDSTQTIAADDVRAGGETGVVFAWHQVRGRGRFAREWISSRGESLTMSLIFREYADHPLPYLLGMELAAAAAGALHTQLQWPNDLCLRGKKVGGILTELVEDPDGHKVPVVGIGINLNQEAFPDEIRDRATSLHIEHGGTYNPIAIARQILDRLSSMPEPSSWHIVAPLWNLFDDTPGKRYKLSDGEDAVAIGLGPEGELFCSVQGESRIVLAADAIFGSAS